MLEDWGPGGVWASIRPRTMPVEVHKMPAGISEEEERVPAWVASCLVADVTEKKLKENWVPGGEPPPQPNPDWKPEPRVIELWEEQYARAKAEEDGTSQ